MRSRFLMAALMAVTAGWAQELGPSLAPNSDFESEDAGGWRFNEQRCVVEMEDAPSGSQSVSRFWLNVPTALSIALSTRPRPALVSLVR